MENWYLIANPVSGGFRCRKYLPEIAKFLNKHGIMFAKAMSKKKMHTVSLTKDAIKQGYRKFISVGGDGTANEIVNGIMGSDVDPLDFTLAVIPAGTGNDWGRSVGIPDDFEVAVKTIKKGKHILQDICKTSFKSKDGNIHERYFVNVAGAGYDAEVLFKTERMKEKGKKGQYLYFYNIFTSLFSYKPVFTNVKIDGKEVISEKALSINIGIGKYNGGGMMQVPHAEIDDGLLAFTFIGDIGKMGVILNSSKLKSGQIGKVQKVQLLKGKKIEIVTDSKMLFEADGEALGETPLTFEVVGKKLRVISSL
jgi:diacylglycerol kinase (ATP)